MTQENQRYDINTEVFRIVEVVMKPNYMQD